MKTGDPRALPFAKAWFERTVVGPGVTRYREPHAHPLLRGNFYLVEGRDRNLVFDSGLGVVPLDVHCPELLAGDPLLVLSHAHLDHAGGAAAFAHRRAHAAEAPILKHPPRASLWDMELARAMGVETDGAGSGPSRPGARGELLIDALPWAGYDPDSYELAPVSIEYALEDGDVIELGDRSLTVLYLPGHTPGCIGLLDEHHGTRRGTASIRRAGSPAPRAGRPRRTGRIRRPHRPLHRRGRLDRRPLDTARRDLR